MTKRQLQVLKKKYLREGYKMGLREAMIRSDNTDSPEFNVAKIREELRAYLDSKYAKTRGHYNKAIVEDAMWFIDEMEDDEILEIASIPPEHTAQGDKIKEACLHGARDFRQFSEGGMALVSNYDIAKHYCSPTEFKKLREGQRETQYGSWIEVQASALLQSYFVVRSAFRKVTYWMNK